MNEGRTFSHKPSSWKDNVSILGRIISVLNLNEYPRFIPSFYYLQNTFTWCLSMLVLQESSLDSAYKIAR